MTLSLRLIAVAAATLAAACAAARPARAAPAGCGSSSYSYAGVLGPAAGYGVGARLTATRQPAVAKGHVAGWVGVGGAGMGPNATDEWLQVGISATDTEGLALYYELALPNVPARYVMLKGHVPVGKTFAVAVLEVQGHPGSWQVWVNGTAVTGKLHLPGSHGAWRPVVTAESWNGDTAGTCNGYAFSFAQTQVATKPGGGWKPLTGTTMLSAPGYHVRRLQGALVATGGV
jgi:hypothetical protein